MYRKMNPYSILLLLFLCLFHESLECPLVCECEVLSSGVNVDCSKRKLTTIPSGIPINTKMLYLYENNLSILPEDSFSNLESLSGLYLYSNKIQGIPQKIFWNLRNLEIIHIADNQVDSLINDTFKYQTKVKELHLQQNNITRCEEDVFSSMESLQYLYLYENGITEIYDGQFGNLTKLRELHLQSNRISAFSKDIFVRLTSLEKLDLSKNKISTLQPYTFFNLSALKTIYLSSNTLTTILANTFVDLVSLSDLLLYDNKISSIEARAFVNLPKLQNMLLHVNDIICNCNIRWFWSWLLLRPTLGTTEAVCKDSGQYITDIDPNSFEDCDKISITLPPIYNCQRLKAVRMSCTLAGQGGISSRWYHYKSDNYVKTLPGTLSGSTNVLTIEGCTSEDTGTYICSWNTQSADQLNINGSTALRLIVDLGLPLDMTCNISSSISVACNFSYSNVISNKWTHSVNGVNGVTIRKLSGQVADNINTLSIPQCSQEDAGLYTCEWTDKISNAIVTNNHFTLQIIGPPVVLDKYITSTIKSRILVVKLLSTPQPSYYQWMFGNTTVQISSEYEISFVAANLTVIQHGMSVIRLGYAYSLTIIQVTEENIGNYYFQIDNRYGTVEGEFEINPDTVLPPVDKDENDVGLIVIIVVCFTTLTIACVVVVILWKKKNRQTSTVAETHMSGQNRSGNYPSTGQLTPHLYDSMEYDMIDAVSSRDESEYYIDAVSPQDENTEVKQLSGDSSAGYISFTVIGQSSDQNLFKDLAHEEQVDAGIDNPTSDCGYEEPVHSRNNETVSNSSETSLPYTYFETLR